MSEAAVPVLAVATDERARLIWNERVKLRANALDRASTAVFAGAILTPGAFWDLITDALPPELKHLGLGMIVLFWTAFGFALHHLADRSLRGLR